MANESIISIQKSYNNVIYSTTTKIFFFNPNPLHNIGPYCDSIDEGILDIKFDVHYNNIIYVLTK